MEESLANGGIKVHAISLKRFGLDGGLHIWVVDADVPYIINSLTHELLKLVPCMHLKK
jgi:hypothetical protein